MLWYEPFRLASIGSFIFCKFTLTGIYFFAKPSLPCFKLSVLTISISVCFVYFSIRDSSKCLFLFYYSGSVLGQQQANITDLWNVGIDYRMKYQRWKDIFIMSNIPEPYFLGKRQRGSSWLSSQESILESWCLGSSGPLFERKFTRTCWKDPRIEIWGCWLPYFCLLCDAIVL